MSTARYMGQDPVNWSVYYARRQFDHPSAQLYLAEAGSRIVDTGTSFHPCPRSFRDTYLNPTFCGWKKVWRSRHTRTANFACYDGHVGSYSEDLYWRAQGMTDPQVQTLMTPFFSF